MGEEGTRWKDERQDSRVIVGSAIAAQWTGTDWTYSPLMDCCVATTQFGNGYLKFKPAVSVWLRHRLSNMKRSGSSLPLVQLLHTTTPLSRQA